MYTKDENGNYDHVLGPTGDVQAEAQTIFTEEIDWGRYE